MDWKPLLQDAPAPDAVAVDARVADARVRFRRALDALGALQRPVASQPPPTFAGVIAAAFGPGEVADAWRRWRDAEREAPGALEALERGVEDAQRQVSRVGRSIQAVTREETAIRAEMEAVRRVVEARSLAAGEATAKVAAFGRGQLALDLARARATPAQGAALDADAALLGGLRRAWEDEARRAERDAARLGAVLELGTDALDWCGRLRASLEQVHADGEAVLHELDLRLGRMAAEARAADLGAALHAGMGALEASVARVHLQVREGADALRHRLDDLAAAPDLLASPDPARAAAEREVAELVRRG